MNDTDDARTNRLIKRLGQRLMAEVVACVDLRAAKLRYQKARIETICARRALNERLHERAAIPQLPLCLVSNGKTPKPPGAAAGR
jgi:hypothetical protein